MIRIYHPRIKILNNWSFGSFFYIDNQFNFDKIEKRGKNEK
jgi:hypothetical protein